MREVNGVAAAKSKDERSAHALQSRVGLSLGEDRGIGLLDRATDQTPGVTVWRTGFQECGDGRNGASAGYLSSSMPAHPIGGDEQAQPRICEEASLLRLPHHAGGGHRAHSLSVLCD